MPSYSTPHGRNISLSFVMLKIKFWQQLLKGPWGTHQSLAWGTAQPQALFRGSGDSIFSAFVRVQLLVLVFIR